MLDTSTKHVRIRRPPRIFSTFTRVRYNVLFGSDLMLVEYHAIRFFSCTWRMRGRLSLSSVFCAVRMRALLARCFTFHGMMLNHRIHLSAEEEHG